MIQKSKLYYFGQNFNIIYGRKTNLLVEQGSKYRPIPRRIGRYISVLEEADPRFEDGTKSRRDDTVSAWYRPYRPRSRGIVWYRDTFRDTYHDTPDSYRIPKKKLKRMEIRACLVQILRI